MVQKVRDGRRNLDVRQKAMALVQHVQSKNWPGEIAALFEYVQKEIRYTLDINGIETVANPEYTMRIGQGDCDDKSVLLASLLQAIGHPARFIAVGFKPGDLSHVMVETPLGRRWINLDPTEDRPMGWRPPGIVTTMRYNV